MIGIWSEWRRAAGGVVPVGAVLAALGCGGATGPVDCAAGEPVVGGQMEILFIGNSLTYFNYLPDVVRALADSAGAPPPEVEQVAKPDYNLDDHEADGDAIRALRGACWDVVVLQQGPSSQADSRTQLLAAVQRFAPLIRQQGATPALFSVWPAEHRRGDFPRAIESSQLAAQAVDGVMLPAASAWLQAWERDPGLDLYTDGLHPTRAGTYLAAMVIVARLYGIDPGAFPSGVAFQPRGASRVEVRFDAETAALLRDAARAALEEPLD